MTVFRDENNGRYFVSFYLKDPMVKIDDISLSHVLYHLNEMMELLKEED